MRPSQVQTRVPSKTPFVLLVLSVLWPTPNPPSAAPPPFQTTESIGPGQSKEWTVDFSQSGEVLEGWAQIPQFDLVESDRIRLELASEGQRSVTKELNAGDPSLLVPIGIANSAVVRITAKSSSERELPLEVRVRALPISNEEIFAFETEPNNSWREANPMKIGRTVYGNNDETDYLDNKDENPQKGFANGLDNPRRDRPGLDWFRIDVEEEKPFLVLFELDVLDRDVSVNLRTYVTDASGENLELFMEGSDPMEIVHDREPERYSKAISRILKKGTYYLQVNGNHPRYTLRSKVYGVPPFDNAEDAVKLGAHYIMNVGDAWVAQVPREGNIYRRVENLHDSTLRCTACHPSIFSTEAVLTSVKAGYPIEAKSQFRYVVDRIYNGPTPLYGPFDANWQRYIAIPMQSQGKHGMILKDFEKYVSQKETPFFERYAPFLRHAWTGMEELHPDEANGVVPADSNVGFAIRDWIVMKEAERRSGDRSFGEAAANVEGLISSASCNLKNIQDKIHRVWAFSVMGENPDHYADERNKGIEEILSFQNEDGGWPDIVEPGRPSAVYTTGQVIWTLTQAGHTLESLPQLQKAADYLLGEQKVFGGWYQTSTHENFRTPMRETRYAVMGLAATHPLEGAPHKGWGNRDGGEGRLPAEGSSLLQTLDALDNLWEVPSGREEEFTQALISLLNSEEPSIRSTAAETLGRVGTESAFEPLVALLDDPIKDVWRSAAWALRQFGDAGYGHDRIKELLSDANPAMRRGALRIFAYHYFGIDHRLDIAKEIMKLTEDENFWTRLAAYKTLRQWFYRSGDNAFKREIVDLYIDRMAAPDHSAIRTNLAQGMYIMLDENQAGGVSLERNIARFPYERDRDTVLAARRHVEQSVLLEPVLEALYSGNALQREALLASFDGSFFRGRFYARNPRNMIDVGNDREFSFYYQPPQQVLDRLFESLLYDESLSDKSLEQAARLASFFYVYRDTPNTRIQSRLLALTRHGAEPVRLAAREFVAKDLAFKGAEEDRRLTNQIEKLLESGDAGLQETVLTAARRNDAIVHNEQIVARIESYLEDEGAWDLLLPVIDTDVLSDSQAIEVLLTLWGRSEDENRRLEVLDRFFARKEMVDQEDPSAEVVRLLKRASGDEVVAIREALLKHLEESEKLRHSGRIAQVLHSGLADPSAGIRLKSLALAQDQERFWTSADTIEYVLKLLVDPDPKIRELALASVEKFDLLSNEPRFAKRVKPLVDDEVLGATATALLVAHGFNPDEIEGDGAIQSYGIPDLEFFREKINPIFYTVGHDNHSCYECHQNHNILRISEIPEEGEEFPEELVIQNFNSALKVVNLGDPEQSLILRKPRSPEGQGGEDADSPTGLTHVGGPRWDSKTHPAYQTMLEWIQDAAASQERRVGVSVATDSFSPDYPPEKALDNDPQTIWHTEFVGAMPGYPHEIVIDLGETLNTSAFQYVPRQDSGNGRVKEWELYTSADRENWGEAVASGTWENDAAVKTVPLRAEGIRYVRFKGLSSVDDQPFMSAAEVIVLRAKEEGPAPGS